MRMCKFIINGILYGKRYYGFEGNIVIEDKTNNLTCIVEINPKTESKGFFSNMFSKSEKQFPDYFKGFICQSNDLIYDSKTDTYSVEENAILSSLEGEYNNYLKIDGKTCWETSEKIGGLIKRNDFTLPSDSHLRSDILLFKSGNEELAQFAKMCLEDLQRKDVKLRKKQMEVSEKK